jgi:3-oxoacyl-[acyl-carrier-protein] synthase II
MFDPIAITGAGCISGFGVGRDALVAALHAGRSTIAPAPFDTSALSSHVAGHVDGFDPAAFVAPEKLRRIDRIGRLAVACARLAIDDAGLGDRSQVAGEDLAIALGSQTAGIHTLIDYLNRLLAQGPTGASALDFSNTVGNAAASLCGIELGLRGANVTFNNKEASSLAAVAGAASLLGAGGVRAVVTGGADDVEPTFLTAHETFGVLAHDAGQGEASRPFDRRRNGFVLGAGAYLLVLETPASAGARSAQVLGELIGMAGGSVPCRLNDWPREAAPIARVIGEALDAARVAKQDVAFVVASANSTPALDRVEAEALAQVFGARAVPVVSLKGALGESGASGAAGLLVAIASLREGRVPPTLGCDDPDPDCPVDVANASRSIPPGRRVALVNSIASGGTMYAAVVRA